MQDLWNNLFFILERFTWSSLLDILLVTIVFGLFLYLLRDTEAQTLLRASSGRDFVALLTSLVNLPAFSWLVNHHPGLISPCSHFHAGDRRGRYMGSFDMRFGSPALKLSEELLNLFPGCGTAPTGTAR